MTTSNATPVGQPWATTVLSFVRQKAPIHVEQAKDAGLASIDMMLGEMLDEMVPGRLFLFSTHLGKTPGLRTAVAPLQPRVPRSHAGPASSWIGMTRSSL